MLEQVAVVARDLGHQAGLGQAEPLGHGVGIPLGVRHPGVGVRGEVGVVGEDVFPGYVGGKLHEQAGLAQQHVQRIEGFRVVQLRGREVALAQRGHAKVNEGAAEAAAAETA
jgi:hypothetical protein